MGKASKIIAAPWLADKLLSAMNPSSGIKDASFDFLHAVEISSLNPVNQSPKLNNE